MNLKVQPLARWGADKFFGALIGGVAVILLAVAGLTVMTPDTKNPIKAVFELTQTITVDVGGFGTQVEELKAELAGQGQKLDAIIATQDRLVAEAESRNALLEELLSR